MSKTIKKTRAKVPEVERLMYVGPTLLAGLTQNTVYEGIPASVNEIKASCPLIVNLFVPIAKYPEAEKQIREGVGSFFSAWKSVEAYKAKRNA